MVDNYMQLKLIWKQPVNAELSPDALNRDVLN
jgi:hypothetical protein